MSRHSAQPAGREGNPLKSVRAGLIAGCGLLVLILVAVVAGSAWLVREYQADTAEMQQRADTASLLQQTQANASIAALLMQRYLLAGEETLAPEIRVAAATAVQALNDAKRQTQARGDDVEIAKLDGYVTSLTALSQEAEQMIALRQTGNVEQAVSRMESVVPVFRQFRLDLMATAEEELQVVSDLQAENERTGDLAFWLLIVSGVAGVTLGLAGSGLIARSIIRALSSLELTAMTASTGNMTVRAPASGPRELAKVGAALNHMMTTVQERTEELRFSNEELRERNRQLVEARAQAAMDPLTGLLNHRKFHQRVREIIAETDGKGDPVGLIMLDVDNFKQVNDSLGHLKGDEVLRELAFTIVEVVGHDHGYRYGGDEFAILLPGHDHKKTTRLAQRLLYAVTNGRDDEHVTVSMGVAAHPEVASSAEELVYRADMALNWAKSSGKNQVGDWHSLLGRKTEEDEPSPESIDSSVSSH